MPTKTDEQKAAEAAAERERQARRKAASDRLAAMPQASRDAIRRDAARREQAHKNAKKPRVTAVQFLEEAIDAFRMKGAKDAAAQVRAIVRPGTATGEPPAPKRPKGPREKSTPKEKGRPAPEHKENADELADAAEKARGGRPALSVVTTVIVPEGTAYCKGCDRTLPEEAFWPVKRTDKSKRRGKCRDCFNREWREFDQRRRAAAGS